MFFMSSSFILAAVLLSIFTFKFLQFSKQNNVTTAVYNSACVLDAICGILKDRVRCW